MATRVAGLRRARGGRRDRDADSPSLISSHPAVEGIARAVMFRESAPNLSSLPAGLRVATVRILDSFEGLLTIRTLASVRRYWLGVRVLHNLHS